MTIMQACWKASRAKKRMYKFEPMIMQSAEASCYYAKEVIKGRWLEAEEVIAKSSYKDEYVQYFFDEPMVTKDKIDIVIWYRYKAQGYFAPAKLFENHSVSILDIIIL